MLYCAKCDDLYRSPHEVNGRGIWFRSLALSHATGTGIKCTINEARTYFLGPKYAISLANLNPLPPNLELSHARSSLTSAMTFSDFRERAGARNN